MTEPKNRMEASMTTATVPNATTVERDRANLEAAVATFRAAHPEVFAAMEVMNLSLAEYLDALAAMQEPALSSSNNVRAS